MKKTWSAGIILSYFIVFGTLLLNLIHPKFYTELSKEDGVVEYLTAFFLLLTAMVVVRNAFLNRKDRPIYWLLFQLLIGLAFFFAFGEEISWGQRIFGIESSQYFLENNAQQETNLHNLVVENTKVNELLFGKLLTIVIGSYFFFSQLLYKKVAWINQLVDRLSIPIPKWSQFIPLLITTIILLILDAHKQWEIWELAFATSMLWVFLDPYNKK